MTARKAKRKYPAMVDMFVVPRVLHENGQHSKAKEVVMVVMDAPQRVSLVCFCHEAEADDICTHVKVGLGFLKPWWRSRAYVRRPGDGNALSGVRAVTLMRGADA